MKKCIFFPVLLITCCLCAQRVIIPINDGWQFKKEGQNAWHTITIPHTWNIADVMDDAPGYYRGVGWYRKQLKWVNAWQGKEIILSIGAANQQAVVYVNGKKAGEHIGGYSAFNCNITSLLDANKANELLVKVDNSHNNNIPPLSADFTFYGGMYRQNSLVVLPSVHFSNNDYGSKGVFVTTPKVSDKHAAVHIGSIITNSKTVAEDVLVSTVIYDAAGKSMATVSNKVTIASSTDTNVEQDITTINNPKLWSPDHPYLYKIVTRIYNAKTGKLIDEITNPLGFRWFTFDAVNGFLLNGQPLKLMGASRHQDYKGLGNAVPVTLARKDVALLKEMGGNFLRVAHYPQDPSILQACDELGILASVEIPIVNEITESDAFYQNCRQMQVEMIRQHYNHPSIIMWCYMNEVLLRPPFNNDKNRQTIYFANIARLAKQLDSITRKEDSYRYTMMANHGDYNRYKDAGLIEIPMIVGWNLYQGWYGAKIEELPAFLDKFHKAYPNTPMMITEYGADADPRIRSSEPVRFDKSVEYATFFHRYYLNEIMQRSFVAGGLIWNLADFNSETRNETMPHINNKGLLEWDRTAKDPWYYYKARLAKTPFVKILGASLRSGMADSGTAISQQMIQVASNVQQVQLTVNGKNQGVAQIKDGIAEWKIPFANGINTIEAKAVYNGKMVKDQLSVVFRLQPYALQDAFDELNILLGANRYFMDSAGKLWMPDQQYRTGSWGHMGGKPFKQANNNRLPYGTDKNILSTNNDPIYQTQQTGITAYRFDVPNGHYELTLYFAELEAGESGFLPYNLGDSATAGKVVKRIFSVNVNHTQWLERLNMLQDYGAAIPIIKSTNISVTDNKGIMVSFMPIEGEPVLNAIRLKKQKDTN